MTQAQIAEQFEVVFNGQGYLCIPFIAQKVELTEQPKSWAESHVQAFVPYAVMRQRILAAMPGTIRELQDRAQCEVRAVYMAIQHLRRRGQLEKTGHGRQVVYSYGVRVTGQET